MKPYIPKDSPKPIPATDTRRTRLADGKSVRPGQAGCPAIASANQEYSDRSGGPTSPASDRSGKIELFLTATERAAVECRLPAGSQIAQTVRLIAEDAVNGLARRLRARPASAGTRRGIIVRMPAALAESVGDAARDEGVSASEFLVLHLLALPEIAGSKVRPKRPRRVLDQTGLAVARRELVANLLRSHKAAITRYASTGGLPVLIASLDRIEAAIAQLTEEGSS